MLELSSMKDKFSAVYGIIGKNVKAFRKQMNWSQSELASRCSVNREKISKIENAREDYMLSTLLEVLSALNKNLIEVTTLHDEDFYNKYSES